MARDHCEYCGVEVQPQPVPGDGTARLVLVKDHFPAPSMTPTEGGYRAEVAACPTCAVEVANE